MESHPDANDVSEIAKEILDYLAAHPDAQDTVEGIVKWWLLEQRIKRETARVKEALAELVGKGLLLEKQGQDRHTSYSINGAKREEIQKISSRLRRDG